MIKSGLAFTLLALAAAGSSGQTPAPAPPEATACADRFAAALEGGDRAAALAELAPDVLIFESGGVEHSRDEYASHHLDADMKFLHSTETRRIDRWSGGTAEAAWVLTLSETTGTYNGKPVASLGAETLLLRHFPDGWKIVHIHWSSHSKSTK